jgi:hypothetical protein
MKRSQSPFVPALALLSLLLLAFAGSPATSRAEEPAPDLSKYLGTYRPDAAHVGGLVKTDQTERPEGIALPVSKYSTRSTPVVRVMPAGRWSAGMDRKPDAPYTWPDRALVVWGRVDGGDAPYTFEMTFGDGSAPVSGPVDGSPGRKANYIAVAHVYSTAGPKVARLTVTYANNLVAWRDIQIYVEPLTGNQRDHDVLLRRNAAVQDGLRWLYLQQASDGSWPVTWYSGWGGYRPATALALSAFEMAGYYPGDDPSANVYAEFIHKGLEYLFSGLVQHPIGMQSHGNPDSNGNGVGLRDNSQYSGYLHGLIMYAIALSRDPSAIAQSGGAFVAGRTYQEILTDMVDQLAWCQGDAGPSSEGGWRYDVISPDFGSADNTLVQWATIALNAAERPENLFGIQAPSYVKPELQKWLNYSRGGNGSYGYAYAGYPTISFALTGAGIFSEYYCGLNINMADPGNDPRILTSLAMLNSYWCYGDCFYTQFPGNLYAMYAVKKALDDMDIVYLVPPATTDWYADYMHFLLKGYTSPCVSDAYHQVVELYNPAMVNLEGHGYWPSDCLWVSGTVPATAMALLILTPGITCDLYPRADAVPSTACPGDPVSFDASSSFSTCPDGPIVDWRWDFDDRDGADINVPDATGLAVQKSDGYALPLGDPADTVQVTLWLINGAVPPDTAETRIPVIVTRINHEPVACLSGPFTVCVGDSIRLSACCSYDPDDGTTCGPDSVALYEWDLEGNGSIDFTSTTCTPDTVLVSDVERTVSLVLWVTDTRGTRSAQAVTDLTWTIVGDLQVATGDVSFNPPDPVCGEIVEICAQIHVTVPPGAPPMAETKVRIYHDEYSPQNPLQNLVCEEVLTNLVSSQVVPVCCNWQLPGATTFIVVVDGDQQVEECVETDNLASGRLECRDPAGLPATGPAEFTVFGIQSVRPNPASGRMEIGFGVPRQGPVTLVVFDAAGRLVRRLMDRACTPGRHTVSWDGLSENEQAVPAGVYFVRGRFEDSRVEKRFVIVQ